MILGRCSENGRLISRREEQKIFSVEICRADSYHNRLRQIFHWISELLVVWIIWVSLLKNEQLYREISLIQNSSGGELYRECHMGRVVRMLSILASEPRFPPNQLRSLVGSRHVSISRQISICLYDSHEISERKFPIFQEIVLYDDKWNISIKNGYSQRI